MELGNKELIIGEIILDKQHFLKVWLGYLTSSSHVYNVYHINKQELGERFMFASHESQNTFLTYELYKLIKNG